MANNIFECGTTINIEAQIKTLDGTPTDPTTLTFSMLEPGSSSPQVISYTSEEPDGNKIIRHEKDINNDSIVGSYYIEWPTTVAGQYEFLYTASGNIAVTKRGYFSIQKWN